MREPGTTCMYCTHPDDLTFEGKVWVERMFQITEGWRGWNRRGVRDWGAMRRKWEERNKRSREEWEVMHGTQAEGVEANGGEKSERGGKGRGKGRGRVKRGASKGEA